MDEPKLYIDPFGNKSWTLNGKRHRIDGPAFEYINGDKTWFVHNKCHREDGPAIEWDDGAYKEWRLNGVVYTFDAWCEELKVTPEEKTLLVLKYG